jgi:RNA polymerase sigma-B factor
MTSTGPEERDAERNERDLRVIAEFAELRETGDPALRDRLIEDHRWMAAHAARRFLGRGESADDLIQVGMIGLIKAVDRFEPARATAFGPFAFVTIIGEIRRYFRDSSWRVKAPRRAKDLQAPLAGATEELSQRLGRSPRPDEVAEHLGIDLDDVLLAMEARTANRTSSLSAPRPGAADSDGPRPEVGDRDDRLPEDELVAIRSLLDRLPPREQKIVRLRFYEQLSQSEIAERVGVSQMHVSRLLRVALAQMRNALEAED